MSSKAPLATALLLLLAGCGTPSHDRPGSTRAGHDPGKPEITQALIPRGRSGRWRVRRMNPRYITIHSTQNFSRYGTALAHAHMLKRGALKSRRNSLGYLTWHYTVDSTSIYQSLPDNEQGQHADYEGPGNRYSIGIEMCENAGGSRRATVERTARLVAYLMRKHDIPLSRVVPHQHWQRVRQADGRVMGHKNCPHFLLENGKPGRKWRDFLRRIKSHYDSHGHSRA